MYACTHLLKYTDNFAHFLCCHVYIPCLSKVCIKRTQFKIRPTDSVVMNVTRFLKTLGAVFWSQYNGLYFMQYAQLLAHLISVSLT